MSSKAQELFEQVFQATKAKKMQWKLKSRSAYSDVIFQPNHVFRLFESKYEKDDDDYIVLLVEKKYDDPEWDMAVEKYRPEMYFLFDGSIVLTLDEDIIDFQCFIKLIKYVEITTDRAKKLLG